MPERPTCEYCGKQFDTVPEFMEHEEQEHGAITSLAEQKMAETTRGEDARERTQADQLAGLGQADDPPAEDESLDRLDREVHRPPTPGPDRMP